MEEVVRQDILEVLEEGVAALRKEDSFRVKELSNHIIHNASIFQDEDSLGMAVLMYALAKIMERGRLDREELAGLLDKAKASLEAFALDDYRLAMRLALKKISEADSRLRLFVSNVIEQAQLKKGSKICMHGVSVARTASMLGISRWELMQSLGRTTFHEDMPETVTLNERLEVAKAVFSNSSALIFDAGPVINFTMNNLLTTLERLKAQFAGSFVAPESVKGELVDEPLNTKKFMFEALQIQRLVSSRVFEVAEDSETKELTLELLHLANNCFSAKGKPVQIVQYGEMAALAAASLLDAKAVVVDERITRELVEHPAHLSELMEKRLHTSVATNSSNLSLLQRYCSKLKILRSVELAAIAFEKGLLDRYIAEGEEQVIPNVRRKLLESILWGLKLNGCAVSSAEIEELLSIEAVQRRNA